MHLLVFATNSPMVMTDSLTVTTVSGSKKVPVRPEALSAVRPNCVNHNAISSTSVLLCL